MATETGRWAGVIGLGSMGFGMASSLLRAGFEVAGHDPSPAAQDRAREAGIAPMATAEDVFAAAEVIVLSLPTAAHVLDVIAAAQDAGQLGANARARVIIDTSTSEAEVSRKLSAALDERGHGFLDAPVSGGPAGAASGQLSVMLGGDEKWVAAAMPALEAMAAKILHVGPSGAGNVAKLVNNMLVASHMVTTLEALRLAEAAGVGAEDALRVINSATGRSAISEIHYPNWVLPRSFDSGFSTGLMRKDVRLARELAQSVGCAMPVADLVAELWAEENSGLKDADDFMHMGDPAADRPSYKDSK
ncbi:NAD(P)-dependent oxidoreductase [Paracoccus homiensis]|uniref:3-hydroxyisobutyrate dehydrogenase n=1 Tax=Paracoccus homiensis TaxID=364199 RepID=A0A1I0IS67_9RHOB|nr:NAD(P)-dependent oxidoreductase [Paracoccus homiensis]SET99279.1 3-hydroxyisobutyrate dehydrogenase [Paracoccus homiensis]